MAVLPDEDRRSLWRKLMEEFSSRHRPTSLTKVELRAAIDAVDPWVDDNTSALNQAIPQPARGELTFQEKAGLLMFVVARRAEVA